MADCTSYVRLTLDGVDDLLIDMPGTHGLFLVDLDLGYPTPRDVVEALTEADGTDDSTEFFGASVVTVRAAAVATVSATKQEVLDRLARFMVPRARPVLYYALEDGGPERRAVLRAQARSAPLLSPWGFDDMQEVQAGWVNPAGITESAAEEMEAVFAAGETEDGRTYDLEFDRVYPESQPIGQVTVTNSGIVAVAPIIRLFGPCTNPRIENQTTDEVLEFTANGGLVLASGDYVEIDVAAATVRLNGEADQSRYGRIDWAVSSLWRLNPGDNEVRYYPEVFASPSQAQVFYRSAWI